jgi:hypothetical protein
MYVGLRMYELLVQLWNGRRRRTKDGFLLSLFNLRTKMVSSVSLRNDICWIWPGALEIRSSLYPN